MTAVHGLYAEDNHSTPSEAGATGVTRPPLLSLLVDAGVAPEAQLRLALAEGMGRGERLGEVVLRRGWIDEERQQRRPRHARRNGLTGCRVIVLGVEPVYRSHWRFLLSSRLT